MHQYNAVIIDTINQAMNDTYVEYQHEFGKPGFDIWRDYGVEPLYLYQYIKSLKDAVITQIIGQEGSGKTVGARTLDPSKTMYLNVDRKPLTFTNADDMYPNDVPQGKSNSLANYKEVIPQINEKKKIEIWTPIRQAIQYAYDNRTNEKKFVVFVLAHPEVYKGANGVEQERLRVLGKMATKLNIEGSVIYSFYSKVDPTAPTRPQRYKLTMHNSGFNTARVPMGAFDEVEEIPNDFQLIMDVIQTGKLNLQKENEQTI